MAFFRFSRDKRGYEHFYLVEPLTNQRGKTRPRILYWYRTPPNVRVGRAPFDEDTQRALEARYPDVAFDWRKIVEAPIPSVDVEKWRERRRQERAEKAARQGELEEPDTPAEAASATDPNGGDRPQSSIAGQSRKRRRRRRGGHGPSSDAQPAALDAAPPSEPPDDRDASDADGD